MALLSAFKNINVTQGFETAFDAKDITSEAMCRAIRLWQDLYYDTGKDDCKLDPAQRVPYIIIDGIYKAAFGEYEYSVAEATE